jgi:hypothetical protein
MCTVREGGTNKRTKSAGYFSTQCRKISTDRQRGRTNGLNPLATWKRLLNLTPQSVSTRRLKRVEHSDPLQLCLTPLCESEVKQK